MAKMSCINDCLLLAVSAFSQYTEASRTQTQDCQTSYRKRAFGMCAHAVNSLELGQTRMSMRSAKVFPLDSLGDVIRDNEGLGGKEKQQRNSTLLVAK